MLTGWNGNIETRKALDCNVLVITNRYGGFEFQMGSAHALLEKDGKYGLGEIYCGSEDSMHPLEWGTPVEEWLEDCKIKWFENPIQFLWIVEKQNDSIADILGWDEDSDVEEFEIEVLKYFKNKENE